MVNGELESEMREYMENQVKERKRRWEEFHRYLPDRIVFKNGLTLYRQSLDSPLYMDRPPNPPLRKRRWYWPFWPI